MHMSIDLCTAYFFINHFLSCVKCFDLARKLRYVKMKFIIDIFILLLSSDHRDQGLTRPKVLMVLPFKDSALRVVKMLTGLLMSEDQVRSFSIRSLNTASVLSVA